MLKSVTFCKILYFLIRNVKMNYILYRFVIFHLEMLKSGLFYSNDAFLHRNVKIYDILFKFMHFI